MRTIIFILIILSITITELSAQDYFFTQNTTSQFLSPSYAGINKKPRASLGIKDCPNFNLYKTFFLSYDHYFDKINSGFGVYIINDEAAYIGTRDFAFNYTYEFNITKKIQLRPAIGLVIKQYSIEFNKMIFGDQINYGGTSPSSIEVTPIPHKSNFDFTTSLLVFGRNFWGGFTASHLAPANNSMYLYEIYAKPKFSLFAGYKFILEESNNDYFEKSVVLNANYVTNNVYDYGDVRANLNWNFVTLALGMRNSIKYVHSNTIISIIGLNLKNFKIGYSYDWGLESGINYHEVSLTYLFSNIKKEVKAED